MNSNETDNGRTAATALVALEGWLETLRGAGGYTGPAVGPRGMALAWCGPAHDWRWEGLLDGWVARHRRTSDVRYLDRIEQALCDLRDAQLADGSFRNSCFELNPCEGGMPHEPAVMAAVLRAGRHLSEQGRKWPEGSEAMLARFVEERLVKSLWNKTLRSFNNWLQSEFESFSPAAVASAVEVLIGYGAVSGETNRWTPYVSGAAESLLACQHQQGRLAGAMPISSADRVSASPFLAARCLPALAMLHRATGDDRFARAGDSLTGFVARALQPSGGLACLVFANRPDRVAPLYVGATAGALAAMRRAGRADGARAGVQLGWLLSRQSGSGAFDTAVGFGRGLPPREPPDWRDALPVCGWSAMVYALLAECAETAGACPTAVAPVARAVTVRGRLAEMTEDAGGLSIRCGKETLYAWRKRTLSPDVCFL